jgi:hypothetical protein
LKLVLDEMYPAALAQALRAGGIKATRIAELSMAASSDPDVFVYAVAETYVLLTENVADFVTIAAEHSTTGAHHRGVLIALTSRFSRRPAGRAALVTAIQAHSAEELTDRIGAACPRARPAGLHRDGRRARAHRPGPCGVVRAFRGRHHLHRAGLPLVEPWIESFNARFRDEVLDCELFSSILEARVIADVWRDTYNRYHPHSSLGMPAPAVFAERWRADHTEGVAMS